MNNPPYTALVDNNRWFHQVLTRGLDVEYRDETTGETRGTRVRLVDFDNPTANDFLAVRQLSLIAQTGKAIRPDVTLFMNGLPVVLIELKDPADFRASLGTAIEQIERYVDAAPGLFVPNLMLVASDGLLTRVGTITSLRDRFIPWRSFASGAPTLEVLIRELLQPASFVDYLQNCVVFDDDHRGEIAKKVAAHHQFRAMTKVRSQVVAHVRDIGDKPDGRGGVVWHTQGSGKSLTMLMVAGALVREPRLRNPTIVVLTDRNDLDDQLFETFATGRALLGQEPESASSRTDLVGLLDRASGGVIFTTIQKFAESEAAVSARANVVVLADEAHRSQYGLVQGGARWMRQALPNATFVGFTGTPLERDDKNTTQVFGDYVDIYDIREAVDDGTIVPLYYDPHIVRLRVDEEGARNAEQELDRAFEAERSGRENAENLSVELASLVGAPERLDKVAAFIADHWDERRRAIEGKAFVATMTRDIAARLYEALRRVRPDWHDANDERGAMKVVITGSAADPPLIRDHVRTKASLKELAARFKDPDDDLRVVIVCDMWLTGFDCPPAHTIYLDKPLASHNLMQAIARVNRVFGDKPGGLVVDLLGLADQLADALSTYASAGGTGIALAGVEEQAIPAMRTAFEKLRDLLHGTDYEEALDAEPTAVLNIFLRTGDFVLGQTDGLARFRALVKEFATAFALVAPRQEAMALASHLAFFQRLHVMLDKRLGDETPERMGSDRAGMAAAVRQVVGGAISANEVIDLFAAAGLDQARLDILSDEFLTRVAALEQRNLALETLRKLLNDQIRSSERTNIVQSRAFRDALDDALRRYTNNAITTAEVIGRLIELARELRETLSRGEAMGLNTEEVAFYDALAQSRSAVEVMKSDALRLMARELAEMVRAMPKLDWAQRESVRAALRRNVRRLLARYGYPPDLAEGATALVLRQAELSTANGA
ncbi:MAG: type restriction enzyme subunit [Actinomycetota bacterium]|jgi:type I restriction enzyme R subunit